MTIRSENRGSKKVKPSYFAFERAHHRAAYLPISLYRKWNAKIPLLPRLWL